LRLKTGNFRGVGQLFDKIVVTLLDDPPFGKINFLVFTFSIIQS